MAPFEALYGHRCRTPLNWSEPGERWFFGVDIVKETEAKVRQIQNNLKVARSQQKSYADKRRRPLVFEVGDYVYLKVSPIKELTDLELKTNSHRVILVHSKLFKNVERWHIN
jgi:exosome complex RNA-binding protein Rrp4